MKKPILVVAVSTFAIFTFAAGPGFAAEPRLGDNVERASTDRKIDTGVAPL